MKYPSNIIGKILVAKGGKCYVATGEAAEGIAPAFKLNEAGLRTRNRFYPNEESITGIREPENELEKTCCRIVSEEAAKGEIVEGEGDLDSKVAAANEESEAKRVAEREAEDGKGVDA